MEQRKPRSASSTRITILVVGAVALVRMALKQFLSGADEVVVLGEASAGAEATAMAGRGAPDVALIDVQGMDETVTIFIPRLFAASPNTRPIILSDDGFDDGVFHAAEAGVWGYLSRDVSQVELIRAVRLVAQGKAVIGCSLLPEQFSRLSVLRTRNSNLAFGFSQKEWTVIKAMAAGHTDSQIAGQLGLSVPTIKTHVRSILRKTGSRNRTAAITAAFRSGVLS